MEREALRDLPLDHQWTSKDLGDTFAAVQGAVSYPGKRPGCIVVAGLCQPHTTTDCEIHVLAEAESSDLGELLRMCRGLGTKWRLPDTPGDQPFTWIGNWQHKGSQEIVSRLNREPGVQYGWNYLALQSTPILDMEAAAYPYMLALLSESTQADRKRLYLHGSRAGHAMNEIPREEVAETKFGDFPSIESLTFVVAALRTRLEGLTRPPVGNSDPYAGWPRFKHRNHYARRR